MGDLAVLGASLYSLATLGVQLHGFTRPPRKPGAYAVRVAVLLAWAGAQLVALVGVFAFNYCESGCGSDLNLPTAGVVVLWCAANAVAWWVARHALVRWMEPY